MDPTTRAHEQELIEIKELFERAETRVKAVELVRGDVTVPAINELRYAGNHLLRALYPPADET